MMESIAKTINYLKRHGFKVRKKRVNTSEPSLAQRTALRLLSTLAYPISKVGDTSKQKARLYACVNKGLYPNESDAEHVIFFYMKQSVKINDLVYEYITNKTSGSEQ